MSGQPTSAVTAAAHRRHFVAERYLKGATQYEIASEFGVSQAQISMDLSTIREAWLQSSIRDFDEAKSEQLAKIDVIEAEAWQAWERSRQPREVTLTEHTEGDKESRKDSVRREGRAGDPRFLERVQKCIEQRCGILGFGTPATGTVVNLQVNIKTTLQEAFARAYGQSPVITSGSDARRGLEEPH
jgi:predicted transcriptional regulator